MKNRPYIDINLCSGCSLCIENCPMDCLKLTKSEPANNIRPHAELIHEDECIGCGICSKNCPVKAITLIEK